MFYQPHFFTDTEISKENVVKKKIPSPFKKSLFWPEPEPTKYKIKKEKVPSVATSKEWQDYFIKKDKIKAEKIKSIEERKKERLLLAERKRKNKEEIQKGSLKMHTEAWYCKICDAVALEDMIQCLDCKGWVHENVPLYQNRQRNIIVQHANKILYINNFLI